MYIFPHKRHLDRYIGAHLVHWTLYIFWRRLYCLRMHIPPTTGRFFRPHLRTHLKRKFICTDARSGRFCWLAKYVVLRWWFTSWSSLRPLISFLGCWLDVWSGSYDHKMAFHNNWRAQKRTTPLGKNRRQFENVHNSGRVTDPVPSLGIVGQFFNSILVRFRSTRNTEPHQITSYLRKVVSSEEIYIFSDSSISPVNVVAQTRESSTYQSNTTHTFR